MMYTSADFRRDLESEMDNGYDIVRIARFAFMIYQKHGGGLSQELDEKVLQVAAMEEGPEFEMTEDELRRFAKKLTS